MVNIDKKEIVFEHNTKYIGKGQEDELNLTIPFEVLPDIAREHFNEFYVTGADLLVNIDKQELIITYKVWHG